MKPPDFEYARPASMEEAVRLLAASDGEGKVLAGGQSLMPLLNFRLATPGLLIDLNRVPGIAGVRQQDGQLAIGAMTRMRQVETDASVRSSVPLLSTAAAWVGHVQIRNRGTLGGSLAHADPAAEIPAILLLLDGQVAVSGTAGARTIGAADFVVDTFTTSLRPDEIVTEVRIPIPLPASRWGFREFAQRRGDFALAGAATRLDLGPDGDVGAASVVVFGRWDRPVRAQAAEAALVGGRPSRTLASHAAQLAADEASIDDPRSDASYRRSITECMVRDALLDAMGEVAR
jgi:carbon-monoxide dehydrogenase medium subunit